jgi:hypothetical protein
LSLKGLSSPEFTSWFQTDPALAAMVMRYAVLCAVSAGQSRTYTANGQTYVWQGALGLAPIWANGLPILRTEQRIVSACLAAHANKYGLQIPISVMGQNSLGQNIPSSSWELSKVPEKEACFFGNLFTGEGIYVANNGRLLKSQESSGRACALASWSNSSPQECAPIVRVAQNCSDICTLDSSKTFYVSCTYNGGTYPTLTTRMQSKDIYTCGDGICQLPERGVSDNPKYCPTDCGSSATNNDHPNR